MRLIVLLLIVASAAGFAVQPMATARRSVAVAAPSAVSQSVFMGRGDKRTKKGKMKGGKKGSFGKTRPSKAPLKLRQLKPASYLALNQQQ